MPKNERRIPEKEWPDEDEPDDEGFGGGYSAWKVEDMLDLQIAKTDAEWRERVMEMARDFHSAFEGGMKAMDEALRQLEAEVIEQGKSS